MRRVSWSTACAAGVAVLLGGCNPLVGPSLTKPPFEDLLAPPAPPTGGLEVQFFGTSTLAFSDGTTTILIDGFFSRPGLAEMLLMPLESDERSVAAGLEASGLDTKDLAAVFVAHSHHDHVLDSAAVASKKPGSLLIGSRSTAYVALKGKGDTLPRERICVAGDRERFTFDAFTVTTLLTRHSTHEMPPTIKGEIGKPLPDKAWLGHFRTKDSFAFLIEHEGKRILVVPSATAEPKTKSPFEGVKADVVFLSLAKVGLMKRASVDEYWRRTVVDTGAELVVGIHWNDIRTPVTKPFKTIPRLLDNFGRGMRLIRGQPKFDPGRFRLPTSAGRVALPKEWKTHPPLEGKLTNRDDCTRQPGGRTAEPVIAGSLEATNL